MEGVISMAETVDVRALKEWLRESARRIATDEDVLSELDSSSGDADHGFNMSRGFAAVVDVISVGSAARPGDLLKDAGLTLVDTIGGSSGALYGTLFLRMARASGDADVLDAPALVDVLRAGAQGVAERGKVATGDKTMYDALAPAVEALDAAVAHGRSMSEALHAAAEAAEAGRDATVAMVARRGRSSYVGERSVGHADAGATSMAMLIRAAATTLGSTTR